MNVPDLPSLIIGREGLKPDRLLAVNVTTADMRQRMINAVENKRAKKFSFNALGFQDISEDPHPMHHHVHGDDVESVIDHTIEHLQKTYGKQLFFTMSVVADDGFSKNFELQTIANVISEKALALDVIETQPYMPFLNLTIDQAIQASQVMYREGNIDLIQVCTASEIQRGSKESQFGMALLNFRKGRDAEPTKWIRRAKMKVGKDRLISPEMIIESMLKIKAEKLQNVPIHILLKREGPALNRQENRVERGQKGRVCRVVFNDLV